MKKQVNLSVDVALMIKADQAGIRGQYSTIFEEALVAKLSDKGYIIRRKEEVERKIQELETVKNVMGEAEKKAQENKEDKLKSFYAIVDRDRMSILDHQTALAYWSRELGIELKDLINMVKERVSKP